MKPFLFDLQYGSWGADVYRLQSFLQSIGYGEFVPTGFFGEKTRNAVIEFQKDNKIEPSVGYFGPKTRGAVNYGIYTKNKEKLYAKCLELLNTDVTPDDIVADEYDCADTVSTILKKAGFGVGSFTLTTDLYHTLKANPDWRVTLNPLRGDIVISPTSYGNGNISNGHVGFVGNGSTIMSNNSYTGLFEVNYTFLKWKKRYVDLGGYPMVFFRKL